MIFYHLIFKRVTCRTLPGLVPTTLPTSSPNIGKYGSWSQIASICILELLLTNGMTGGKVLFL